MAPRRRPSSGRRSAARQGAAPPRRVGERAGGRHILITGFEPFAGDRLNPSREIARALGGRRVDGTAVRAMVLPVHHETARDLLAPALQAPGLTGVLQFGLAGGRARIAIEAMGVNTLDYMIPDARGDRRRDEPCASGGPAAYWSTLPLRAILDGLTATGIPAYVSYTAGTYLCNFTLYSTLHRLAGLGRDVPAGFIHVPYLPEMVATHGLDEPSMDLGVMLRAAEVALAAVASGRGGDALAPRAR
ncbi:MAG TPA: pyroglutamyl-peptidase I [Candidatus Binatia bacterium]|nr:pyroglutamyl-peptidase I [Candidatus Binatia bacterium]